MEGLTNIFQSIIKLPDAYSPTLLAALEEHQSFNKPIAVVDPIITHISAALNSSALKNEGLIVLNLFLNQCALEILEEKISQWIQVTTKATTQRSAPDTVKLAFVVLTKLIARSQLIPEATKNVSNNHLAKIVDSAVNAPEKAKLEALDCLEECMKGYAGPCGVHKNQIEKFLFAQIDTTDDAVICVVGKCLLQLQQTRGGGTQGSLHKTAWAELQQKLLGSLHDCLGQLYANVNETYDAHGNDNFEEKLKLAELELSSEPVTRVAQLNARFGNLLKLLEAVLIEPYPVSKFVKPMLIFRLIFRGLAVNCTTLPKNTIMDNIALGALLPNIHIQLLDLLKVLILLLRGNCILYSNGICDVLVNTLKWTSSGRSKGFTKPYSLLRKTAYEALSLLCETLKYGSQVETLAEPLVEQILQDILPFKDEVTLKIQATGKNLSKKAKKAMRKQQNDTTALSLAHATSVSQNLTNKRFQAADLGNEVLCEAALLALRTIMECCGCSIKPVLHRLLGETVVSQCFMISATSDKSKLGIYASIGCRRELYAALHALVMNPHHLCPAPLQYAVAIFGIAQHQDSNPEIRMIAAGFSRSLEKILHPQKGSFHYDADENDVKAALRNVKVLRKKFLDKQEEKDAESANSEESDEESEMKAEQTIVVEKSIEVDSSESSAGEEEVVEASILETPTKLPVPSASEVTSKSTETYTIEESDEEVELVKKRHLSPDTSAEDEKLLAAPTKKQKMETAVSNNQVIDILTDDGDSDNDSKDSDVIVDELVASFVDEPNE